MESVSFSFFYYYYITLCNIIIASSQWLGTTVATDLEVQDNITHERR
jgi:hypothetical protein